MFRSSRPAKPSLAPSPAIVKAASVAFQPLVPDWKLPFGSRLLETACARGDKGSVSTANKTIAPAVFPNSRARLTFGPCVVASYHSRVVLRLMIRLFDAGVPATGNWATTSDYQPGGTEEFGVGWLAMYRETSAKVNAFGPEPTA